MRILAILIVLSVASQADAQLFRRFQSSPTQNCPGGVCLNRTQQYMTPATSIHYGYPGSLQDHLNSDHGGVIDGLTHKQMLLVHDARHRGLPDPQFARQVLPPQPVTPVVVMPPKPAWPSSPPKL